MVLFNSWQKNAVPVRENKRHQLAETENLNSLALDFSVVSQFNTFPCTFYHPPHIMIEQLMGRKTMDFDQHTIEAFCCQNKDCKQFGLRKRGNLRFSGWSGSGKKIRMLHCLTCGCYFSERRGTPLCYGVKFRLDEDFLG